MWVKAYIKYKTDNLIDCDLLFKHGKIQEINMEFFKNITPFENNSELADNIEILKTYKQDQSNNFCKYFIKKSIDKEVHITYLDLNFFQYFKLQWQLKKYLIQSKDLKIEVLKYIIIGILSFLGGFLYLKKDDNQNSHSKTNTESVKSKIENKDGKAN